MYYNSTKETGPTLARAHRITNAQDRYLVRLIESLDPHNRGMTSDEVYTAIRAKKQRDFAMKLQAMYDTRVPFSEIFTYIETHYVKLTHALISIRRSMTDLCEQGYLERTDKKRKGTSGRNNHVYKRVCQ